MKIRLTAIALVIAIASLCLYYDFSILFEYYGSGPPYYGRSTNMDKRENPLRNLALVNIGVAAVIGVILKLARKQSSKSRSRVD